MSISSGNLTTGTIPEFSIDTDPIVEKSYEYELDGITVRKSWTGPASKMPDDLFFDTTGIPKGKNVEVHFRWDVK